MNLRWIECFLVLAKTENFSRAADQLKCSQPSVSRQIRQLEEHLNFQLFIRSQRHVQITEQGRKFLNSIEPLFDELQIKLKVSDSNPGEVFGKLMIGSLREVGQSLFIPMIIDFYKQRSEFEKKAISINLQFEPSSTLLQEIKLGKMDFAVVRTNPKDSSIRCYPFLSEKMVLVGSTKNKKRLTDLTELDFVSHSTNDPNLLSFLRKVKKRLKPEDIKVPLVVNSLQSMLQAVSSLDVFAVMPFHYVKRSIEENQVKVVSDFHIDNQLYFIHPEKNFSSVLEKQFKSFILKQIKSFSEAN